MNYFGNEVVLPVTMFSLPHILFLVILITPAVILALFLSKKIGFSKTPIWICAFIGILCEIEKMIFFMQETEGGFRLPANHLPFNMCPFQVILLMILALSEEPQKHKKLISYMYPAMVGGGFIGMLIPSAVNYYHGLLEFATYRYFFFHAMVIFAGFYLYFSKSIKFDLKSYRMSLLLTFLYSIGSIWVNAILGWDPEVNIQFMVRPPIEGLPILNTNHGWAPYVLAMAVIALLIIHLCYLPAIIQFFKNRSLTSSKE